MECIQPLSDLDSHSPSFSCIDMFLVMSLYANSSYCMGSENSSSDFFNIITRECLLSLRLFILVINLIMWRAIYGPTSRIQWTLSRSLTDLDYADNIAHLVDTITFHPLYHYKWLYTTTLHYMPMKAVQKQVTHYHELTLWSNKIVWMIAWSAGDQPNSLKLYIMLS